MSTDPFGICAEENCEDTSPPKELPSAYNQLKGFIATAKDVVSGAVHGEGVVASEEIRNYRMTICRSCMFFMEADERCVKCGCFMKTKTMFKHAECPVGKWDKVRD